MATVRCRRLVHLLSSFAVSLTSQPRHAIRRCHFQRTLVCRPSEESSPLIRRSAFTPTCPLVGITSSLSCLALCSALAQSQCVCYPMTSKPCDGANGGPLY